jgi:hypothetical protein
VLIARSSIVPGTATLISLLHQTKKYVYFKKMSHEEIRRDRYEKLYNFSNFHTLYPFLNKLAVVVLADFLMIGKS